MAKDVFYCTELNQNMKIVRQKHMRRSEVLKYFSGLDVSTVRCVAMETCGGAHYWGRKFQQVGLSVKLLPPKWVKAYVLNNRTDANDSVTIAEAAQRPKLCSVPVKSVAQQDLTMLHGSRRRAIKTRTQWRNSIRAHLAERGLVTGRSKRRLDGLMDEVLSADEKTLSEWQISPEFVSFLDYEVVQLQQSQPGRQHSGGLSKAGDRYVRTMLINGARAVCRSANLNPNKTDPLHLKARRVAQNANQQKAVVAAANQMARIVWTVLSREVEYGARYQQHGA